MKAMVLAAGYGTRLGSLTRELPKAMLPIAGEPLLAHTLRYLAAYGFDQVMINLHYCAQLVRDHFGDGAGYSVELRYSYEEELLGTAGGVRKVLDFFADSPDFLVVYGDLLIDQDLSALLAFHRERDAEATLLLHERTGSNSLVATDERGRINGFIERPDDAQRRAHPLPWVNSGLQLLAPGLLEHLESGTFADLPRDVYVPLLADHAIYGMPLAGFRIAIDSAERYRQAQEAVESGSYKPAQSGRRSQPR